MKRLTAFAILTSLAVQPAAAWTHGGFTEGTSLEAAQAALAREGRSLEQVTTSNDQDTKTYVVQPAGAPILNFCNGVLVGYIDPIDGGIQGFLRRFQALSLERSPSQMPIMVLPLSPGGLEIVEASWDNPDGVLTLSWLASSSSAGAGVESVSRGCSAAVADASRSAPAGAIVPAPDAPGPAALGTAAPATGPAAEAGTMPDAPQPPAASQGQPPASQDTAATGEPAKAAVETSSASTQDPASDQPERGPAATAQADPPPAVSPPLPPQAPVVIGRQDVDTPEGDTPKAVAAMPAAPAPDVVVPLPPETGPAAIEPAAPEPPPALAAPKPAVASDATAPALLAPQARTAELESRSETVRIPAAQATIPLPPVRPAEFSRLPARADAAPAARAPRRSVPDVRIRPILEPEPPLAAAPAPSGLGESGLGEPVARPPADIEPPVEGASRGMAALGLAVPRSTGSVGQEPDDGPALRSASTHQPPNCTRYRSFNPATRTYTAFDGTVRPCR